MMVHTGASTSPTTLQPRKVRQNWQDTPLHWIPSQPFASQLINALHLFLPPGELMFCRVFNAALPYISDDKLRDDVKAFVRQEAMHARAHQNATQDYLQAHGINTDKVIHFVQWLVEKGPLSLQSSRKQSEKDRLLVMVGVIAAIEHMTCFIGQYLLDNTIWEENGADPVMLDLLKWHGAEEIEHRCVAFDLYQHLGGTYRSRYYLMLASLPFLMTLLVVASIHIMRQDPLLARKRYRAWTPRFWWDWSGSIKTGYLPSMSWLIKQQLRYLNPSYHPVHEGNTEQALAYLAKSRGVVASAPTFMQF